MNTISIDCGASFIKSALFADGKIVEKKSYSTPSEDKNIDAFYIGKVQSVIDGVKEVIDSFSNKGETYSVCISNEMHGFILAEENGEPYTGYISWQKEYGNIKVDGLSSVDILSEEQFKTSVKNTGMSLRAGLPSGNLLFLLRSGKLPKRKLYFYTLGDYIIRRVFGVECDCSESNAAATGLYDLNEKQWNAQLLDLFDDFIIFPNVGNKPVTAEVDGIKYNIFPAIGDYQAALLGAGIERANDISFNLGTGAQVSVISDQISFSETHQVLPFFNGKYLNRIPHLPSGRALNVYFRFFKSVLNSFDINPDDSFIWDKINNSINDALPNEMMCSMSFFENPIENRTKGAIDNIGEYDLLFPNVVKMIYDQVSDNFIYAADKIIDRNAVRRIIFSGGIARRISYIKDKIIGHYGEDIEVVESSDETLAGLYLYSLIDAEK